MILFALIPQITYALKYVLIENSILDPEELKKLLNVLYNLNILFELACLFLYFRSLIKERFLKGFQAIYLLTGLLGLFMFIDQGGFAGHFLSKWLVINNLIYCGSVMFITFQIYSSDGSLKNEFSVFIFNIALFIYTSGTVIYFSFQDKSSYLRTIHDYLNIGLYTLFAIGFIQEAFFSRSKKV